MDQVRNTADREYLTVLRRLMTRGERRQTRSGEVLSLFGTQMRFDLSAGFPALTTKRLHMKSVIVELLWFLAGETNVDFLHRHGVSIWDDWADANGDLGPVYGRQWRSWPKCRGSDFEVGPIDQIQKVVESLKRDPHGRRHIVSAWNVSELDEMALAPCHCLFQFYVSGGRLSCHLYQRSADWFLGVPFNIASYALLTHLIAREVRLDVGEFVHSFGDYHLYADHIDQAAEQLTRVPRPAPRIMINPDFEKDIFHLEPGDIALIDYDPHPAIKAEVAA